VRHGFHFGERRRFGRGPHDTSLARVPTISMAWLGAARAGIFPQI
jgi:hypothetical protein